MSLPEAGESIVPFFCICFLDLLSDLPMVFAPEAPDIVSVAPLAFGVPIPVPPWPALPAPPPSPPLPAPIAYVAPDKPKISIETMNPFLATRMTLSLKRTAACCNQAGATPPLFCAIPVPVGFGQLEFCGTDSALVVIEDASGLRPAATCEVLYEYGAVAVKDAAGHWRFSPHRKVCRSQES